MFRVVNGGHFSAPQTEAFSTLEDGDDGAASQSLTMEQEVTLSQSESTQQLQQEVIVIVTDTESDEEQEEEEDEDEEQVRQFCSIFLKTTCKTVKIRLTNFPFSRTTMTRMKKMKTRRRMMTRRMMMTERWERKETTATRAAEIATSPTKETTQR